MLHAVLGTECIMATLNEDPELSFPPGFGPFVGLALQGTQNNVKPGGTHSSSVQVAQSIEDDVKVLEPNSAHCRSGTPASTSGSHSCRKSLRNRPPIDYSLYDLTSDEESEIESAEKVSFVHISFFILQYNLNLCAMILLSCSILSYFVDRE